MSVYRFKCKRTHIPNGKLQTLNDETRDAVANAMSSQNEELLLFGCYHKFASSLSLDFTISESRRHFVFTTIWTWIYKYTHLLHRGKQFTAFAERQLSQRSTKKGAREMGSERVKSVNVTIILSVVVVGILMLSPSMRLKKHY